MSEAGINKKVTQREVGEYYTRYIFSNITYHILKKAEYSPLQEKREYVDFMSSMKNMLGKNGTIDGIIDPICEGLFDEKMAKAKQKQERKLNNVKCLKPEKMVANLLLNKKRGPYKEREKYADTLASRTISKPNKGKAVIERVNSYSVKGAIVQ